MVISDKRNISISILYELLFNDIYQPQYCYELIFDECYSKYIMR